jgi:hypothetical protein
VDMLGLRPLLVRLGDELTSGGMTAEEPTISHSLSMLLRMSRTLLRVSSPSKRVGGRAL